MNIILIAYLIIFALFGTAASYFVQFIYAYWVKKEMPMKYIVKAGISVVLVVVISALIPFIG
jgi:ABC-type antimicrobial peptide transport system permease subunit